jgi:hypothetical protein
MRLRLRASCPRSRSTARSYARAASTSSVKEPVRQVTCVGAAGKVARSVRIKGIPKRGMKQSPAARIPFNISSVNSPPRSASANLVTRELYSVVCKAYLRASQRELTDEVLLAAAPYTDLPALTPLMPADATILTGALVAVVRALRNPVGPYLGQVVRGTCKRTRTAQGEGRLSSAALQTIGYVWPSSMPRCRSHAYA